MDKLSEAINQGELYTFATKNTTFSEEEKVYLRKLCEEWKKAIFALNISFNSYSSISATFDKDESKRTFLIPEKNIESEVAMRVLFSL